MGRENLHVTTAATAAPTAGPTYPKLLARLWLVQTRVKARTWVKKIWPRDTADDRRLAAVLFAVAVALFMLLGSIIASVGSTLLILHIGVGFFGGLGVGFLLLFGPRDYDFRGGR